MLHGLLALSQELLLCGKRGKSFALKLKFNYLGYSCDPRTPAEEGAWFHNLGHHDNFSMFRLPSLKFGPIPFPLSAPG